MRFEDIYKDGYLPDDIEWLDIVGEEGRYQVSNYGHIKRLFRVNYDALGRKHTYTEKTFYPKMIGKTTNYYTRVSYGLNRDFAHRLVAKHFLENPHSYPEVNHKNGHEKFLSYAGTKANNYEDGTLEWCTRKLNMIHASTNGLLNRTSERRKEACRRNQKLSTEKNQKKVIMYNLSGVQLAEFASIKIAGRLLNISSSNISRACVENYTAGGFMWRHKD